VATYYLVRTNACRNERSATLPEESPPIKVSRRIEAPAARIFEVLADPRRHADIDGSSHFTDESQMLRGALSSDVITGVGDVFSMKMYFEPIGDYVINNYVVEYELNRRVGWEPAPGDEAATDDGRFTIGVPTGMRWSFELTPDGDNATVVTEIYDIGSAPDDIREGTREGEAWVETMTETLTKLDELCGH
jgi:uncharacterized protein YndB with AHSA1/START domain